MSATLTATPDVTPETMAGLAQMLRVPAAGETKPQAQAQPQAVPRPSPVTVRPEALVRALILAMGRAHAASEYVALAVSRESAQMARRAVLAYRAGEALGSGNALHRALRTALADREDVTVPTVQTLRRWVREGRALVSAGVPGEVAQWTPEQEDRAVSLLERESLDPRALAEAARRARKAQAKTPAPTAEAQPQAPSAPSPGDPSPAGPGPEVPTEAPERDALTWAQVQRAIAQAAAAAGVLRKGGTAPSTGERAAMLKALQRLSAALGR